MIQGIRLLPFIADIPIFNCNTCQNGSKRMRLDPQPIEVRRRQGCGLLPRAANADTLWGIPKGVDLGDNDEGNPARPMHCAGYLASLPEVIEAVRIRVQWLKGGTASVREYLGDADVDLAPAMNLQAELETAVIAKQNADAEKRAREAEERRRNGQG